MKIFGSILLTLSIIWLAILIIIGVRSNYNFTNQIGNYWTLADRASTIEQKSQYIDKYVTALKQSKHSDYNAIWLKTPENSFDENLKAVSSLQKRLDEIKTMKPDSFEYQTAIQQITAQEQGEAGGMLNELNGCWTLANYSMIWDWIVLLHILGFILLGTFGVIFISISSDN